MGIEILLWFQSLRDALGIPFSIFIAILSDVVCYGSVIFAFLIYWCKNKNLGRALISIYGISSLINQFLKATFTVYRPWIKDANIIPTNYAMKGATGYSFPSSHTQTVSAVNGSLAINKSKKSSLLVNVLIIVFVAFSRLFIGVHTPLDVIFGILIGGVAIAAYYYYKKIITSNPKKEKNALLIIFIISLICIFYALFKKYPETYINNELLVDSITMKKDSMRCIAIFLATFIGIYIEKTFIKFSTEGSNNIKTLRFFFGLFLAIIIFVISRLTLTLFLPLPFARFLETFFVFIHATAIYPYLFSKYEDIWMNKLAAIKQKEVSIFPHE